MKIRKFAIVLVIIGLLVAGGEVYGEIVYTKDGETVKGTITEIVDGTVWMEVENGEIVEYVGVDQEDIDRILNDDGTYFDYAKFANTRSSF